MRLKSSLAIALLATTGIAATIAMPWMAFAQSSDPDDDDDEDSGDDGDDDADVPDPDDEASDPDPVDDPTDDPGDEPGGGADNGGSDGGGDGGGAGDDGGSGDGGGSGDDGGADDDGGSGAGDDDDDAPGGGDDDSPAGGGTGGDDDDDDSPAGGGSDDGDDDDDNPAAGGASTGGSDDNDDGDDDDDDDAQSTGGASSSGASDDDDDDDGRANGGAAGDDNEDGVGDSGNGSEFIGDEEIIGGGDESESERIALDERDGIETDREGFRYRSREFVALDLDAAELAQLSANGFELVRSDRLGEVGGTVHLLRGPRQISDDAALSLIEDVADPGSLSFNHLFDSSSGRVRRVRAPAPVARTACGCQIGLIDTGVGSLPSFRHVTVEQRAFNGTAVAPRLHGTAVAHLFAGTQARPRQATRILVADIFGGERASAGSTYALVRALDWLASRNIPVINVSLAGPRNSVVASTVQRLTARGHVIVAAAGNDGPAAPPVFPGAYQNVVAVTAVDNRSRIYRYANRGNYVDFAARGVDVTAINARGETTAATGTSFAAPVVAAQLATRLRTVDADAARTAIAALEAEAQDLGDPGRDTVYGSGLVPEGS